MPGEWDALFSSYFPAVFNPLTFLAMAEESKGPQVSVEQLLQIAIQHHQAGRLSQAESLYRQILLQHPDHPDALHLLGLIATRREKMQLPLS